MRAAGGQILQRLDRDGERGQVRRCQCAQVALQLLASIPHGLYVEFFPNVKRDPMWFELPQQLPRIRDGCMELPDGPGLGMPLNEEIIAKYRTD